jgi:hypothetical protein
MRIWHVAALALAGWYLMLPPKRWADGGKGPAVGMAILSSFDTADECESSVDRFMKRTRINLMNAKAKAATCIATHLRG